MKKITLLAKNLCLPTLFLLSTFFSYCQHCTLDPSFASNGLALNSTPGSYSNSHAVVIQPDGKIVTAGVITNWFGLMRYMPDGSLDSTFGINGVVNSHVGGSSTGQAMALQPDGKIVVGGKTYQGSNTVFCAARYLASGDLDSGFADNGFLMIDSTMMIGNCGSVAIQNDGKILLAGTGDIYPKNASFALVRLQTDGKLDSTFGNNGLVLVSRYYDLSIQGNYDTMAGEVIVKVQSDQKIVVGGTWNYYHYDAINPIHDGCPAVMRFNTDGTLDQTYAVNGMLPPHFIGVNTWAYSMVLTKDDKTVLGGTTNYPPDVQWYLAQFDTLGQYDATFASSGVNLHPTLTNGYITSLAIDTAGRIVAGGSFVNSASENIFTLARYLANGNVDTSFGPEGADTSLLNNQNTTGSLNSVTIQPDNKIVATGYRFNQQYFETARYYYGGQLCTQSSSTMHQSICTGSAFDFHGQMLTQAGIYNDTMSNSGGCDSIITLHLNVNNLPASPNIVRSGDSLSVPVAAGQHVQWQLNGNALTGDTSSAIILSQNGSYVAEVTDSNGCSSNSDTVQITNVGVPDVLRSAAITVYPNPTIGALAINGLTDGQTMQICNYLGQRVSGYKVSSSAQQIDISDLEEGVYFLQIFNTDGNMIAQFTIGKKD